MPRLWANINHDLACLAADKALREKWRRNDVRTFLEEWTGYSRYELLRDELQNSGISHRLKWEITEEVALVVEDMVADICRGNDPEFDPVAVSSRRDGNTGKVRDIATLCFRHQLLDHTVRMGIEKLLAARILPTQHASIPAHGQTRLTRQVQRFLNRKKLSIKVYQKLDGVHAYASIQYSGVIKLLQQEIPRAKWILKCMEYLGSIAPGGHLIIGGYLDAWLFNYVMSYALRYVLSLQKSRRGNRYPLVVRAVTFMDDVLLLAANRTAIKQAASLLQRWLAENYGMKSRTTTGIVRLESVEAEKRRKKEKGARRGLVAIDMGGYRIARSCITLRKRNAPRIMKLFARAWAEYRETGTVRRQRACQLISRNGMLRNSDSRHLEAKYHVVELMRVARKVQGYWSREAARKRKEKVAYVVYRHNEQCTA